jgi:hypothetical protein
LKLCWRAFPLSPGGGGTGLNPLTYGKMGRYVKGVVEEDEGVMG